MTDSDLTEIIYDAIRRSRSAEEAARVIERQVRERVAAAIEADLAAGSYDPLYARGLRAAAHIARGEP